MPEALFLLTAAALFTLMIVLGWRHLPGERFQMLATIPVRRRDDTHWHGINFTWYGLLLATAAVIGIVFVLILAKAAGQALVPVLLLLLLIVGLCVPAARWIARLVEHKQYTFTIGGAFCLGLAATPVLILLVNGGCLLAGVPLLSVQVMLAALGIGYILGEGLGRLACLSFGCCYGKPLHQCGRLATLLLDRLAFVFTGPTKKAVYEGGLAGVKLVPIQGLTCLLYTATGLVASHLFLQAHYRSAFLASLMVSQVWRVLSEMLRADFRGFSTISAYQKMGLAAIVYGSLLCLLLPEPSLPLPDIASGLVLLLDPLLLLGLKALWFILFLHFGRSMVTGATLSFEVRHNRI
jgi:prolipoprotein diacylglyceryltransferase